MYRRMISPASSTAVLITALFCGAGESKATTYTYLFESAPLTCANSLACSNDVPGDLEEFAHTSDMTLVPLQGRLVVDEDFTPGGSIVNAMLSWSSGFENGVAGAFTNPPPSWLLSFTTNYGSLDEADNEVGVFLETGSNREITGLSIYRWTLGGVPQEYDVYLMGGSGSVGVSFACDAGPANDEECFSYSGPLSSVTSTTAIPVPFALANILVGVALIGSSALLRRRRR